MYQRARSGRSGDLGDHRAAVAGQRPTGHHRFGQVDRNRGLLIEIPYLRAALTTDVPDKYGAPPVGPDRVELEIGIGPLRHHGQRAGPIIGVEWDCAQRHTLTPGTGAQVHTLVVRGEPSILAGLATGRKIALQQRNRHVVAE